MKIKTARLLVVFSLLTLLMVPIMGVVAQSPTPPQEPAPVFSLDWASLWLLLQAAGLPGLVVGVFVLVFVFIGQFTDIFPNGFFKRMAVIIGSALFSNITSGTVASALTAALAILFATLGKMLVDALIGLAKAQTAARAAK